MIAGIPAVWQDGPGPLSAAVGFRVGRADEPLPRSGLTHLVEHLALSGVGDVLYGYNGCVTGSTTWFSYRGPAEELADFLRHLQDGLVDVPIGRIEAELGVLRAEESHGPGSIVGRCMAHWFGSVGWGTLNYPEYGLNSVDAEAAQEWSTSWFGTGNAVVWMTGEPPAGATLDLPPLERQDEPRATRLTSRPQEASWTAHGHPLTAVSYIAPRTDDTTRAATILQARLRRLLRERDGTSYEVGLHLEALDVATVHVLLTADGPPSEVVEVVREALDDIVDEGPTEEELVRQRATYLRAAEDPASLPDRLARLAHARLCGWPAPPAAGSRFALDDTSAASVVESIESAAAGALILVPPGTAVPESLAVPVPERRARSVEGRTFKPLHPQHGNPRRLIVGPAGVTDINGAERTTVRVGELTAILAWPGGVRALIAGDGTAVVVDPAQWAGPSAVFRSLDANVAADLVVPMRSSVFETRPRVSVLACSARTSLMVFGGAVLWLFAVIMWAGVFSDAPDANPNPIGPLLYTGLAIVVTLSLRERLIRLWASRVRRPVEEDLGSERSALLEPSARR